MPMTTALSIVSLVLFISTVTAQVTKEQKSVRPEKRNMTVRDIQEQPVNMWEPIYLHRAKVSTFPRPTMGSQVAAYRRMFFHDGQPQEDFSRVLVTGRYADSVDSIQGSWIYTPIPNSWFHIAVDKELEDRFGHSLVTWCETNVLLFGGYRYQEEARALADIWLFDGVVEEWSKVEVDTGLSRIALHRAFHSAVTMKQRKSPCRCQDSMIVYGGLRTRTESDIHSYSFTKKLPLDDLIEFQCVEEKTEQQRYSWVLHEAKWPRPPPLWLHFALRVNCSYMLVYGGSTDPELYRGRVTGIKNLDTWWYDSERKVWKKVPTLGDAIPFLPIQFKGSALFHEKYNMVILVTGNNFNTFDFRNFTWQCVSPKGDSSVAILEQSAMGLRAVVVDGDVLVFSGVVRYQDLSRTKVWQLSLLGSQWAWSERSSSEHNLPVKEKMNFLFSIQLRSYVMTPVITEIPSSGSRCKSRYAK